MTKKDGSNITVSFEGRISHDVSAGTQHTHCLFTDVTERKRVEDALKQSEEKYRTLAENANEGIVINQGGKAKYINPKMAEISGYTIDELMSRSFIDFIHPEDRELVIERELRRLRGEQFTEIYPFRAINKLGDIRWLETNSVLVSWENRPATLNFLTDITERMQAEEELRNSVIYLNRMVEQSPSPMSISDDKGNLLKINRACCELLNITEEEVVGKYNIFNDNIVEEQGYMPLVKSVFERGEVVRFELSYNSARLKNLALDRTVSVILDVTIFPIVDTAGKITNAVIQHRDITGRKEAQKTIEKQREEYRIIFDSVRPMVAYLNNDGVFLRINRSGANFLGKEPREIVGKTVHDLFPSDEAEQIIRDNNEVMNAGTAKFGLVRQYSAPSGEKRWANIDRIPYFDDNGNITGIIAFIQDITRRKLAEDNLQKSYQSLQKSLSDTIKAMAKIVEMKDPYTAGHQIRVAELATAIAVKMNMPDDKVDALRIAATIHDIGKIYVPSDILSKPGKLSDIEYQIIQTHPQGSYEILKDIDFPWPIAQIVYQHHERLDGSGYPRGLKDGDIMPEAKILAVADTVEAMASHRPYRPAQGTDKALDEISNNRGILYDPQAADACLELFRGGFEFKAAESINYGG